MSNTAIPKVTVAAGASSDEQPEVDVSDEEFSQFDTSSVPVIVTLTKVIKAVSIVLLFCVLLNSSYSVLTFCRPLFCFIYRLVGTIS